MQADEAEAEGHQEIYLLCLNIDYPACFGSVEPPVILPQQLTHHGRTLIFNL
jgi:hypothetical protein